MVRWLSVKLTINKFSMMDCISTLVGDYLGIAQFWHESLRLVFLFALVDNPGIHSESPPGSEFRSNCSKGSEFGCKFWSQFPEVALCQTCLLWNVKNFFYLWPILAFIFMKKFEEFFHFHQYSYFFFEGKWRIFPFSLVFIFFVWRKVNNSSYFLP